MNENKNYKVTNRSAGRVVYKIPEDGIRREFQPREVKYLPYDELAKLTMQPGGRMLMENYLLIEAEEITSELNIHTEPEYYLKDEEIIELIKHGSQDEWLDMLDFAPEGVLDLVKAYSVSIPLNDVAKREALFNKTGFSVDSALANLRAEKEEEGTPAPTKAQGRRVHKDAPAATPGRRTSGEKYKVIAEKDE